VVINKVSQDNYFCIKKKATKVAEYLKKKSVFVGNKNNNFINEIFGVFFRLC